MIVYDYNPTSIVSFGHMLAAIFWRHEMKKFPNDLAEEKT